MVWLHQVAWFFGGAFLANAVPHLVNGVSGHSFQTPFARPRGPGRSSPVINVVWGAANLLAAYLLLVDVGDFDPRAGSHIGVSALGALLLSLGGAHWFGRFNDDARHKGRT
jgi:hypothetical protein